MSDEVLFSKPLWFGITRWRWMQMAYGFAVITAVVLLYSAHDAATGLRDEERERAVRDCVLLGTERAALMGVLDAQAKSDGIVTVEEFQFLNEAENIIYRYTCTAPR